LELALYQGKDKGRYTGKQLGAITKDLRQATCIEEVFGAYLEQVRFVARKIAEIDRIRQVLVHKYIPRPFCSAVTDGCIEKGRDCMSWGCPGEARFLTTGLTNVANSLAAIKKFVFEDKLTTMDELIEACRTNFEGREDLRQMLLNRAPKYGNDDDYVDMLAKEVHLRSNEVVMETRDRFVPIHLDGSIAGGYFAASTFCGALPDGKKDSEPVADGVLSPMAGTDTRGPTAVLKSASKVPFTYFHLLNQKFLANLLEGENKKKFTQYLKTWADLGIGHIQFNVAGKEVLLDAQRDPNKYRNLIIRVAGYSAYFVDLPKELQDDIIKRTEQSI
jgi:formate C-acetyltransferase